MGKGREGLDELRRGRGKASSVAHLTLRDLVVDDGKELGS